MRNLRSLQKKALEQHEADTLKRIQDLILGIFTDAKTDLKAATNARLAAPLEAENEGKNHE